jgi:hypothetical protein
MPFDALSAVTTICFEDVPPEWAPLIFTFDPDLPLFPIQYFHVLAPDLGAERPGAQDRAFGYIRQVSIDVTTRELTAEIICNKDLETPPNKSRFYGAVRTEVAQRLGLADPVTLSDVTSMFPHESPFSGLIPVLTEIWYKVAGGGYGGQLPFGRFWDPVWGLARAYASYRSDTGRKAEMIQTHYFCSRFGEKIANAANVPTADFRLLPTWQELTEFGNPLKLFPKFERLVRASIALCNSPFFQAFNLTTWSYTGLAPGRGGAKLSTAAFKQEYVKTTGSQHSAALMDCFNAFNKGPIRTVSYLMALNDFRQINRNGASPSGSNLPRINPAQLSAADTADVALHLGHQQLKKVIAIYAQQAHANRHAFPIDTWIGAIMAHPLNVARYNYRDGTLKGTAANRIALTNFISTASHLGKVERLLWVTAQARKIHSPICDDALWCIKESAGFRARGPNPLACKACAIRDECPAYDSIRQAVVSFNRTSKSAAFKVITSRKDNVSHGQTFTKSVRLADAVVDEDTPGDSDSSFKLYPNNGHPNGHALTVAEFVDLY